MRKKSNADAIQKSLNLLQKPVFSSQNPQRRTASQSLGRENRSVEIRPFDQRLSRKVVFHSVVGFVLNHVCLVFGSSYEIHGSKLGFANNLINSVCHMHLHALLQNPGNGLLYKFVHH